MSLCLSDWLTIVFNDVSLSKICQRGRTMADAGMGAMSPAGPRYRVPWWGVRGEVPLKMKAFVLFRRKEGRNFKDLRIARPLVRGRWLFHAPTPTLYILVSGGGYRAVRSASECIGYWFKLHSSFTMDSCYRATKIFKYHALPPRILDIFSHFLR